MSELQNKIYTPTEQHMLIHSTTTYDDYLALSGQLFYDNKNSSSWHNRLRMFVSTHPDLALDPNFFRLSAAAAALTNSYGFYSLDGQVNRHESRWPGSPASPKSQLAVTTYMARRNLAVLPLKEELVKKINDNKLEPGVWIQLLYPDRPKDFTTGEIDNYRKHARDRLDDPYAICLPDKPLYEKFAALEFTGDDAHRMPQKEFDRDILPAVQEITTGLLDHPITVFSRP